MPRNLTDLMEAAVSAAPPETHHASDITRLAERAQRRRTTFVAGAAALAVIAVGGGAFGLTHGQDSTPEPAAPTFRHGVQIDVKDAVPASSLRGFRVLPWTQPSEQPLPGAINTLPTYVGVDDSGRLLVETYVVTGVVEPGTIRLYDAPGQPAAPLQEPASRTSGEKWTARFTGDGRLLWTSNRLQGPPQGVNTVHVTDLSGGHDASIQVASVSSGVPVWVTGDHAWYAGEQSVTSLGVEIRQLFTVPVSGGGAARLVAKDVLAADVSDGHAAWVTTDGKVHVANADGSHAREVPVPLGSGCTLTPAPQMNLTQAVAVSRGAVALTERCGKGDAAFDELLAFDMSGRLLVHVKGFTVTAMSLSGSSLAIGGVNGPKSLENLVYDLRTGTLASLGRFTGQLATGTPQAAGRYVLWYDGKGGHVGEFTG